MSAIKDDRGFNQIFEQSDGNLIRLKRRARWMTNEMNTAPGKKKFEIGCGTGYVAYQVALQTSMQVLGSDLCKPFIKEAREKYKLPNLLFEVLDFNKASESVLKNSIILLAMAYCIIYIIILMMSLKNSLAY